MAAVAQSLKVHMLDVGQGEAILMDLPDGSFALFDGGPTADASVIIDEIAARTKEGRRFCFAGITQWDQDHIRGIPAVLASFTPEAFYVPGIDLQLLEAVARTSEGDDIAALTGKVRRSIATLPPESRGHFIAPGAISNLLGVEAHVLAPMPKIADEINALLEVSSTRATSVASRLSRFRNRASVALWIQYAGRVLFLSGEAEGDQYNSMEQYFLRERGELLQHRLNHAADWIKLSHHGADENNPDDLFKLFAKRNFVGSASAGGGYNHPHPLALKRLHIDHGGVALCTNLGKGCNRLLTEKKLDPGAPDRWTDGLNARRNPNKPCYRRITVTVTGDGQCSTETQGAQRRCPYGGPADGRHSW